MQLSQYYVGSELNYISMFSLFRLACLKDNNFSIRLDLFANRHVNLIGTKMMAKYL